MLRDKTVSGATETLRIACREVALSIDNLEKNIEGLRTKLDSDTRQLNEITSLSHKFDRANSAKSILANVDYKACPRCTQELPERAIDCCIVCGQPEPLVDAPEDFTLAKVDIQSRTSELQEINSIQEENIKLLQSQRKSLVSELYRRETELNRALTEYDSAYLSTIILKQKQLGANSQQIVYLSQLLAIARKVDENQISIGVLKVQEKDLRAAIKEAKASDNGEEIIQRLQKYFLQCLVDVKFPGLTKESQVDISSKSFIPKVIDSPYLDGIEPTEATFANVSSGGKMSIFKACFAIAIHRVTIEEGSILPDLLIIDSPMKNISERENEDQFLGFYNMVYALAANEMRTTQFILIDKELVEPKQESLLSEFTSRHMTPDNPNYPPLIRNYQRRL